MWENLINSNFGSSCAFFEESILFDSQTMFLKHENIKAIVSYPMSTFWDRRWTTANLTRERNLFCISWVFKFFQLSLCLQIYYTKKNRKNRELKFIVLWNFKTKQNTFAKITAVINHQIQLFKICYFCSQQFLLHY